MRETLAGAGVLESGGCVSQFSAHVVAAVLEAGGYDAHVAALRRAYASRRDALTAALDKHLPPGCAFSIPAGGFFLWITLPAGLDASGLLPVAEEHGVAFAPGRRFCADGADRSLRLAFSLYDEASLAEGAKRLGGAIAGTRRPVAPGARGPPAGDPGRPLFAVGGRPSPPRVASRGGLGRQTPERRCPGRRVR